MTLGDRIVVMKDGDVQQVGSPLTIYREPATTFVATFIGSPSMNLLNGRMTTGPSPALAVDNTELRLAVAPPSAPPGVPLTLGIRPEAVRIDQDGPQSAVVDEVELLGGETIVSLTASGARINAKIDGARPINRGATVRWSVAPADLHWFDGVTGKRVGG